LIHQNALRDNISFHQGTANHCCESIKMQSMLLRIVVLGVICAPLVVFAQQRPSLFVDKYNASISYRTNVCDRQRLLWNGSATLADALRGLDLNVMLTDYQFGTVEDKFFSLEDGKINQNYPGLHAIILDEVALRAGFRWRDSFAVSSPLDPLKEVNKTWTDILLWGIETFDIVVGIWGKSVDRISLGVSFPTGWYDISVVLVEHFEPSQSTNVVNIWAFLNPFTLSVWLAIVGFITLTGLVYWLLEYLDVNTDEGHEIASPLCNIYLAATAFTGHFSFAPNTHPSRILAFSWTFWVLIVVAAYTANLASFMVTPNVTFYRVSTFEDAIRTNAAICVQGGALPELLIRKKYPELRLVPQPSELAVMQALRIDPQDGGCDAAAHKLETVRMFQRIKEANPDCKLSTEEKVQIVIPAGFTTAIDTGPFRCTTLISDVLDYHLTAMVSDGFVDDALKDYLNKVSTIECVAEPPRGGNSGFDEMFSLSLEDVGGIFVLHVILSGVSIALACFQFYYYKTGKNRTMQEVLGVDQVKREVQRGGEAMTTLRHRNMPTRHTTSGDREADQGERFN
jgi:hypothetical protein